MKLGLITMVNVPSFMNQAVLIRKAFVESGWEVSILHCGDPANLEKERYDRGIALLPLWPRYIFDATRMLAPWFCRAHLLYGPVDGPFQTNMGLFDVAKNFRIITPSEFCRQAIQKSGIPVLGVVPHGINHEDFTFDSNPKYNRLAQIRQRFPERIILFANLNPLARKGFVHLQRALEILHRRIGDKYIFILHTGLQEAKKLNPTIEGTPNLLIEDHYAKLPFREVALKMASCDIYVHPALNEGFGEPILEAIAAGRTVVCLNAPAMNEIVSEKEAWLFPFKEIKQEAGNHGGYFDLHEYDPADLADAMQHAIEDTEESKNKAQAGYERSQMFDYRKVYKQLVTL